MVPDLLEGYISAGHKSVARNEQLERERRKAFSLLQALVAENYAAGRRSYGSSLKSELRRRTFDGFDERRLQFGSFGRFLEASEDAGVIRLHKPPKADLEATPPGTPSLAALIAAAKPVEEAVVIPPPRKRIRRDLWGAFLARDRRLRRVYDRQTGSALLFPVEPAPLERPESQEVRQLVREQPNRFLEIDAIPFERELGWLHDFAQTVSDGSARTALDGAFADDRPLRAFSQALQASPHVRQQWSAAKLAHVEEVIRRWADGVGLELEVHEPVPVRGEVAAQEPDCANEEGRPRGSDKQLKYLRSLLHEAIERMPEAELRQIRLPLEYLVRRDTATEDWRTAADRLRSLQRDDGTFVLTKKCSGGLEQTPYPSPPRMVDQIERLARLAIKWAEREGRTNGRFKDWARAEEGLEIAMSDRNLVELELDRFYHEGRAYSREPHVKVDDAKAFAECGRIYFAIDHDPHRFIIDHIGLHLY